MSKFCQSCGMPMKKILAMAVRIQMVVSMNATAVIAIKLVYLRSRI